MERNTSVGPLRVAGFVLVCLAVWGGTSLLSPEPSRLMAVTERGLAEKLLSESVTVSEVVRTPWSPTCASSFDPLIRQHVTIVRDFPQKLVVGCTSSEGVARAHVTFKGEVEITRVGERPLPSPSSLLPPLLGIICALIFRKVLLALFAAVFFGAVLATGGDVFGAIELTAGTYLLETVADDWNLYIFGFTVLLVGMIHVSIRMGGMQGIVDLLSRAARGRRSAQMATAGMGVAVFFDDYANTIVVGASVRPLTDRWRISREKLAYIVDSTAAPIAGIAIVSTWIGFEIATFNDQIAQNPYLSTFADNGYDYFFQLLPYRFYCLFSLALVFLIAGTGRDFGPMLKAERRALTTGLVRAPRRATAEVAGRREDTVMKEGAPSRWLNGLLPVLLVVVTMFAASLAVGGARIGSLDELGVLGWLREAFIAAGDDSMAILFWASVLGAVVAITLALAQRILSLGEAGAAFLNGMWNIAPVIGILVLAIGLRAVTTEIGTDKFLVALIGDAPITILPIIIFGLAAVIAFATGTSWGTMGILLPVALPLLAAMAEAGNPADHLELYVLLGSAAVLDGAIFGDHCSVISDTTIMSSLASGCDHVDHVKTQFPYALLAMITAGLAGYLFMAVVDVGVLVAYPTGLALMVAWLLLRGRRPEQA